MENPLRSAPSWVGNSLLAVGVFAVCWTASVVYWRTSGSTPSGMAIGQLLLGVPVAILLALWLGNNLLRARAAAPAAATPPAAAAGIDSSSQRGPLPGIAAGAVRLRGGESLEELAESLLSNTAPCELDSELTDDAGYPVLSGRIESADDLSVRDVMMPWLASRGMDDLSFSEEQWRALSLGGAVVAELTEHALLHPRLPDFLAASPPERAGIALPVLRLRPLLPAGWPGAQRQAAADWYFHLVEQQGWPAQRLQLANVDTGALSLVDELAASQGLTLLIACDSYIGEDSVRDWSERRILFSGRTPRGQVPGEGAAGLLLADATQAPLLEFDGVAALHGAGDGQRPLSADAPGNINVEMLSGLSRHALQESKTEPGAVTAICADADLRPTRIGELMGVASALLPQLDLATQMMSVGACCGTVGAVGPVAALALAGHDALANGGEVLCLSNSDSHYRCAVLVRRA
ncbi:MAG: hypothetical protein V4693_04990 [Pseudomonadota bacterium]